MFNTFSISRANLHIIVAVILSKLSNKYSIEKGSCRFLYLSKRYSFFLWVPKNGQAQKRWFKSRGTKPQLQAGESISPILYSPLLVLPYPVTNLIKIIYSFLL